jgi:hypothetical protein
MTSTFRDVTSVEIEYAPIDPEHIQRREKFTKPERVTISDSGYIVVEEAQEKKDGGGIAKTHIIPLSAIQKMSVDENVVY